MPWRWSRWLLLLGALSLGQQAFGRSATARTPGLMPPLLRSPTGLLLGPAHPSRPAAIERVRRLVRLAAQGNEFSQRKLAKQLLADGRSYHRDQWLSFVRALFRERPRGWVLIRPLRRVLVAHIRENLSKVSGAAKGSTWRGTRAQRSAALGLAATGGVEGRKALTRMLRAGGGLASLAAEALRAHPSSDFSGAGIPRKVDESPRLVENRPSLFAKNSTIRGIRRRVSRAIERGEVVEIERRRVDKWIASGSLPWVQLGSWIASLRRPGWAEKIVRKGSPVQISAIASNAMALSDDAYAAAARRLSVWPEQPLRSLLGFSLLRLRSAELISTELLRQLARENLPLKPLAMRALAARCSDSLFSFVKSSLADPDPVLRAHVADGLQYASASMARRLLREAYEFESDAIVRRAIVGAMRQLGGNAARLLLAEARRLDPDARVRALAGQTQPVTKGRAVSGDARFVWRKFSKASPGMSLGFVSVPLSSGLQLPIWGLPGQAVLVVEAKAYAGP